MSFFQRYLLPIYLIFKNIHILKGFLSSIKYNLLQPTLLHLISVLRCIRLD